MPVIRLTQRQWDRYHRGLAGAVAQRLAKRREALILEHLPMAERLARHLAHKFASHLDIRDLVQEGRVGLIQAADRYRSEDGAFPRFAYLRVRGAIIDANKRRAYKEEQHASLEAIEERLGYLPAKLHTDPGPQPDEIAADAERMRRLEQAMSCLTSEERAVFRRAVAGERPAAIAASYGRASNWARVRLYSAREKMAAELALSPAEAA